MTLSSSRWGTGTGKWIRRMMMNSHEFEVGDVLISIGGNQMCIIEFVDVERGFYRCEWISYFGWKDWCRFGNIDPNFVKVGKYSSLTGEIQESDDE